MACRYLGNINLDSLLQELYQISVYPSLVSISWVSGAVSARIRHLGEMNIAFWLCRLCNFRLGSDLGGIFDSQNPLDIGL
jgi:hypothetical protein